MTWGFAVDGMKLLRKYRYLFYRIYSWNLRTWGKEDLPQLNALLGVSALLYFNLLSAEIIIQLISGFGAIVKLGITKFHAVFIALALLAANYFVFLAKGQYLRLEREFGGEPPAHRKRGSVYSTIYVLGTFILFFALVILKRNLQG